MLAVAAPDDGRTLRVVHGLAVSAFAAAVAVLAHCTVMPEDAPSIGTLFVLVGVCGVLGSLSAGGSSPKSGPRIALMLLAAQVLGHLVLSIGSTHAMGVPSPAMAAAHVLAALAGIVVVHSAERAAGQGLALLHRLLDVDADTEPAGAPAWALVTSDAPLIARCDAARRHIRRGPPVIAAPALP
ncbi:hypothetical protein [Gordonia sp. (in: high G+C Gram-positive bacteria)]|uniref:hypothetical protein n=1 Tax=Gordonia sp. (in: high G+C Gram-positive bacteria) TaxID=84139 RepID=UPI0039E3CFF8